MPTVEALMCGTEVIVPDTRVLREVAGAYGHFYGVEDGIELGNLLTQAMNGSLPLKAQHFENRYDWDRSAQQFLSLLNALLGGE
jgi:glycosyltransferase involved in cell wall biosynthesis